MTQGQAFVLHQPTVTPIGVIVDSPHSGLAWPDDFDVVAPREAILTTWDAFVDELWAGAPGAGASLLTARFPRAYVDVNRAVDDIDVDLLDGPWPGPVRASDYTRRGMGLIRRLALPGVPMYDRRLEAREIQARLDRCYHPYRTTLGGAIDRLHATFAALVHINAHSMKSRGNAMNVDSGAARPDIVVSDRHGTTADPDLTKWTARWFGENGFETEMNTPYQGGDLVASFGAPATGRHSIQIELNRALYMDEARFERSAGFDDIQRLLTTFVRALGDRLARDTPASRTA